MPPFLTSAQDGDVWPDSCPGRFTGRERDPGVDWLGGWVGPMAGLDAVENRKNFALPESIPDRPASRYIE
jgi:hypothetical protein